MGQQKHLIEILKEVGAIITNSHMVGTSGKHMSSYINKDALYPHAELTSQVGEIFANKYKDAPVDVVVSPALGAIILSQWVAFHLSKMKGKEILGVYTEKTPDKNQILTRGYDKLVKGKNVLIIEDIVTTGGSIKKVIKTVEEAGGTVIAACAMVNKDPAHIDTTSMGVPFDFLTVIDVEVYDPENCVLCQTGVPINTTVGHGKEFLAKLQK